MHGRIFDAEKVEYTNKRSFYVAMNLVINNRIKTQYYPWLNFFGGLDSQQMF